MTTNSRLNWEAFVASPWACSLLTYSQTKAELLPSGPILGSCSCVNNVSVYRISGWADDTEGVFPTARGELISRRLKGSKKENLEGINCLLQWKPQ